MKIKNKLIIFTSLFFLVMIISCNSDEPKENQPDSNRGVDATDTTRDTNYIKYSIKNHPCLKDSSQIVSSPENPKLIYDDKIIRSMRTDGYSEIKTFNLLIESSNLFSQYSEFMKILNNRISNSEINESSNPKYLLIRAIEDINQKKYETAIKYLNEFMSVNKNYTNDRTQYFNLHGCYQKDLDWITNFEESDSYKIAKILKNYSMNALNENKIDKQYIIDSLREYDSNFELYDFIDNLIFIIMKNENSDYSEFASFFKTDSQIIYSDLHEIYEDGREIYLTSQTEMLSYLKYFQSKRLLDSFNWDKIFQNINARSEGNSLLFKEWELEGAEPLYALMHFYEYTLLKFSQSDHELYNHIKEIIEIMEYENCYTWLDVFNEKEEIDNSEIRNLISNDFNFDETIKLIDKYSAIHKPDSTKYFLLINHIMSSDLFDKISSDGEYAYFKKANPVYLKKIENFIDLGIRYKANKDFPFDLIKYFYYMYNMQNTNNVSEVSSQLHVGSNRYLNKGSKPVLSNWNFVRSLYRPLEE